MSFRTGPREPTQVSSSVKVISVFFPPCSVRILSEKLKATHTPQHSSPCSPTSQPRAGSGVSVAQNAGCQDSEPALVPQCYTSASVSPENSILYSVLGRRYRGRVHQSSSPPPRSSSVPQFPGVRTPCSSSLHRGSGVPRGLDFPTSSGPELQILHFCSCFLFHTSGWRRHGAAGARRSSVSEAGGRHDVKLAKPLGSKPLRPQPLRRQRFRACARGGGPRGAAGLP